MRSRQRNLDGTKGVVQIFDSKSTKSLKITDLAPSLMSKKRDKNTKDNKDKKDNKHKKRYKNKKTDDQKWERLDGYYKECEARRRGEGRVTKLRIKALTALLHEIYSPVTPNEIRMIPYMVCFADREFRCHSYRQHVSYLQTHQGLLRMYGLKTVPSKSCLHQPFPLHHTNNSSKSNISHYPA